MEPGERTKIWSCGTSKGDRRQEKDPEKNGVKVKEMTKYPPAPGTPPSCSTSPPSTTWPSPTSRGSSSSIARTSPSTVMSRSTLSYLNSTEFYCTASLHTAIFWPMLLLDIFHCSPHLTVDYLFPSAVSLVPVLPTNERLSHVSGS